MKILLKTGVLLAGIVGCCVLTGDWVQAQEVQPSPTSSQSVKLTMIVTDRANHSVDDVRQEEIQVVDDKLSIPISLFVKDVRPVDYALAIDTSGSFRSL